MKRLPILKAITHFAFIISTIALIFIIPAYIMLLIMPGTVPFKIDGEIAEDASPEVLILILLTIVGLIFFVYALYLFRKVLDLFSKRKFFDDAVIKNFDQIGKALIIGAAIATIPAFLYDTINGSGITLDFSFSFDSFLFTVAMGIFFMVLSEVFLAAKNMKEENDLTV
jgi:hypothetical protein